MLKLGKMKFRYLKIKLVDDIPILSYHTKKDEVMFEWKMDVFGSPIDFKLNQKLSMSKYGTEVSKHIYECLFSIGVLYGVVDKRKLDYILSDYTKVVEFKGHSINEYEFDLEYIKGIVDDK